MGTLYIHKAVHKDWGDDSVDKGFEFALQKSCVKKWGLSAYNHSTGKAETGRSLGLIGTVYVSYPQIPILIIM